jgi:tetratricopeptide (TPR) repeat protein
MIPIPDELKQRALDSIVNFLVGQAETRVSNEFTKAIGQLSSQAAFNKAFDKAIEHGITVFQDQYRAQDEDLVIAIITDGNFWEVGSVREALLALIKHPGVWLPKEQEAVVRHFADVLPTRINRDRVDKAVTFFLRCVVEDLWTLPGAKEIREIYSLQFQKIETEVLQQQVQLLEAQLQATTQLSSDVRQGLLQLATILEQRLLTSSLQSTLSYPLPYHNLPQPDYTVFVGRHKELDWLRQHLLPSDRVWEIEIVGIGGVGKSSLAQAIAYECYERYKDLPLDERFDAIIWISAKEEILTIRGREKSGPPGLIFRTLEEMYTTIAQTLDREDITRAIPEERDHLVQKALKAQRTLLIVDNLEGVKDERVKAFLRNLPVPTKCIITSRERIIDTADVKELKGLSPEEAEKMIIEASTARGIVLDEEQRKRVFRRTSGLPLPIKLGIARMASGETFDQVMRWMGDARGDLAFYCIEGSMDVARNRNPDAEKLLFACSLFDRDAGASREALGFVTDLSITDRDEGLTLLQRLSLVSNTDDRFRMLPIVQEHARAMLIGTEVDNVLTKRWLSWLLGFIQIHGSNLNLYVERASEISPEYQNILSAIRWGRENEHKETLIRLVKGIWTYPYLIGLLGELQEMLEAAIKAAEVPQEEQERGLFLRLLGQLFRVQGQNGKAMQYLEEAEKIARSYQNNAELGRILCMRLIFLPLPNQLFEKEQLARDALEIGNQLNDLELNILAVHRLSDIESKKGQFSNALSWLDQGEQWADELKSKRELAWNMYRRGAVLKQLGETDDAVLYLTKSLVMSTSWNEHRLMAHNNHMLAQVYLDTTQVELAIQTCESARDLYERLGMTLELTEVEKLLHGLKVKYTSK